MSLATNFCVASQFLATKANQSILYLVPLQHCIIMSNVSNLCAVCHKSFKRLSTHIAQSPICEQLYTTCVDVGPPVVDNCAAKTLSARRSNATTQPRLASIVTGGVRLGKDTLPERDENEVDHDNGTTYLDDSFPLDDDSATDTLLDEDGEPNKCVFKLYEELRELRSNPLGLDRFSREEKVHIELLQLLKVLKAPLNAFTQILNWAAQANNSGHTFHMGCQPSREKVVQKLYCRYNMQGLIPKEKQLYLPYSQRTVSMIYFDAAQVFASLLSCPLLNRDENFLFHPHDDPFVEPSISGDIGDINTGRCYRKTYQALVKKKGVDMILPTVLAMDKTQVDTYGRMQMEPITLSHGLLKHAVRSQHSAMRILGYVCQFPAHKETQTSVTLPPTVDDLPDDIAIGEVTLKPIPNVSWSTYLLNEMHMQIKFIIQESGFLNLQRNGFDWMLHYKGKVHPIVLHPYIPFIIGDTEGHDRLCGHYTARFSTIKQLCRSCECPTLESGYSKAKYRHRKPSIIDKLVRSGDLEGLKAMSQNYLVNGFDQVRFGQHNDRGIFGACPGEMLHVISLGWFKYCLEAFATQAGGPQSSALKQYDGLCASIGRRLSRHSDRDLPRLNFPKGFSLGTNLMGHEMAGCLLVKLFALHTTRFRQIFSAPKKKSRKSKDNYPELQRLHNEAHIADWILVVSSLLQWHQWMKQPSIPKAQVKKSHSGIQWLIRQIARVSPRTSGMGNNTIKTHLALHLSEDILDHGVPENVNSAYAESAHIPLSKITARNTQKRAKTFTKQAANRYIENLAIGSAWHDMQDDALSSKERCITVMDGDQEHPDTTQRKSRRGRGFTISWPVGDQSPRFDWNRTYPTDNPNGVSLLPDAMEYLAHHCLPHMADGKLPCFTEFICTNGHKYRAHPSIYDGKPWHDHAMVKWQGYPYPLPAFIHTFVDICHLSPGARISLRESGQPPINAGVYALVHSFDAIDEDEREYTNSMIGQYKLHCNNDASSKPTLYMVDVDNLVAPTIGIPDLGRSDVESIGNYLFLFRRKEDWASSWDSMIDMCHESKESASIESQYEVVEEDDDVVDQEEDSDGKDDVDDGDEEDDIDDVDEGKQDSTMLEGVSNPSCRKKRRRW